jgi:hypothetical protein
MSIFLLRSAGRGPRMARAITRARVVVVVAVAAMLIAALGLAGTPAGAARAAPAGAPPGALIGAASGGGNEAQAGRAAGAKQCFYTFPNCTSTDPTANFKIVSSGDTSSCSFTYTTVWGDGKTDVSSFAGGPDGATLVKFSHTYDVAKPQTWTISVTGVVTMGTTCTANGGTLMFTLLPKLGVGAVRFAPLAEQSKNTTPGLPVIKDNAPSIIMDHQVGPHSCDGIDSATEYDYLNCGTPVPSGSPAKVWPVIYAKGDSLALDAVVFAANGQVPNPQLTATASLSGSATASFSLHATALTQTKTTAGYLLTGSSLKFTGPLPDVPGRDKLTITWTVTDLASGIALPTVTSSHIIYLTAGKYAAPTAGVAPHDEYPFVTVLDTGIVAASGVSGEQEVFNAIWRKFTTLTIKHPILDPVTGLVSDGPPLTYYNNGFTTLSDGFNGSRSTTCDLLYKFLLVNSAHCGIWARFFAMVMAFQGIKARAVVLTGSAGFNPGPAPGDKCGVTDCAYMLVDPKLWDFKDATGGGTYRFRDRLTVTRGGAIDITGGEVTYSSTSAIAQGPVSTPPMWFTDGDHVIDEVTLPGGMKWVDPSYGDPMPPITPIASISAYEPHALAGFAVVYKKEGTKLVPLQATYDKSAIVSACSDATCYFQAFKGI